jgi:hypothetical protein
MCVCSDVIVMFYCFGSGCQDIDDALHVKMLDKGVIEVSDSINKYFHTINCLR